MIVVTGASGKLGRLAVEGLLAKVPASQLALAVRSPEKVEDFARRGVQIRKADYTKPESLEKAFAGADKLLLISANEVGQRAAQHQNAIAAAKKASVKLIVYTSILRADASKMLLAKEHLATEQALRTSGIPYVLLRNGWYIENYTENLGPALNYGVIMGAARDGRIAAATRADFAAAAVAVLTSEGHAYNTYELAGDEAFTMSELAAAVSRVSGKQVAYKDLTRAEYATALKGFGLPAPFAEALSDSDERAAEGELDDKSGQLRALIGRPTTKLETAIKAALQK